MINRQILITLLNNVENVCAYDIEVSNHTVTFCTTPEHEPEVYNLFGFCIHRLTSHKCHTSVLYVIQ